MVLQARVGPDVHPILTQVLQSRGWRIVNEDDPRWVLNWQHSRFPPSLYHSCERHQRLNRFRNATVITRKDNLARQLRRMRKTFGKIYDFVPKTYILPLDRKEFDFQHDLDHIWIMKPCASSQGREISLCRSKDLSQMELAKMNCIVQDYIRDPMLIDGYKFDLRLYVLVKSFQPLHIYLYRRGLVRFSSESYDLHSISNIYSHLTNSSINKHNEQALNQKLSEGHRSKWTLSQLYSYLQQRGVSTTRLRRRIRHLIVLTMASVVQDISANPHCFEVFGIDILLDANAKPWLLEVNASPALAVSCIEDEDVKIPMLNDLLDRVGFPLKSSPGSRPNEFDQIYPLSGEPPLKTNPLLSTQTYINAIRQEIKSLRKPTKESDGHPKVHIING